MNTNRCKKCGFMEDVLHPTSDKRLKVYTIKSDKLPYGEVSLCWDCILKQLMYQQNLEWKEVLMEMVMDKIL